MMSDQDTDKVTMYHEFWEWNKSNNKPGDYEYPTIIDMMFYYMGVQRGRIRELEEKLKESSNA